MPSSYRSSHLIVGVIACLALTGGAVTHFNVFTIGAESGAITDETGSVDVVDVSETAQVRTDSSIQIAATITNTHDSERTKPVALKMDVNGDGELATTVAIRNVTARAGESTGVTCSVPNGTLSPGTHAYGVVAGNVSATPTITRNVTVLEPPTFAIEDPTESETVVAGEDATVVATVRNHGDYGGVRQASLAVDADGDGTFQSDEVLVERTFSLKAGESSRLELPVPTDGLGAGTYDYRVEMSDAAANGTMTVEQPATFRISGVDGETNVTRGESIGVSVTLTNRGDVSGTQTLTVAGANGTANASREVTLEAGASTTLNVTANTTNLSRGNYTVQLSTDADDASVPVRVREGVFSVTDVRGTDTITIGDELSFTATVTNTGDANDTQSLEYKLDLDGNDRPESYDITKRVTLAPGEETDVTFTIPYTEDPDPLTPVESLPADTYVYGVYSEDSNATGVFVAKRSSSSGSAGGSGGDSTSSASVSLDEISQQKYGYYYDQISGETRAQVTEIYERQPFADGLVVTEVLTREEIARQQYGLDVGRGDEFEFDSIDVETQQRIEADFDAQFQSDAGDRIESWDELARERYGSDYESLSESQQQSIRSAYREQF